MLNGLAVFLLVFLSALSTSCASYNDKSDVSESVLPDLTLCEEPRPKICTREYNPVCASYKDGSKKTGSTGCTACSKYEVVGYTMGACKTVTVDE